ncbi:hypothetical protein BP5796_09141 [Coleophoma crateriformis]|uniref:Glycoside hydrolase family 3 C-terminal domain-containing protein n=1 Tax=Coleophoma crateriformis TaxID=565419 RepID=A0A3D8R3U6_9HELO|nr:hypothetical protein BP5796_09141 [Coleophoma crateriformis]
MFHQYSCQLIGWPESAQQLHSRHHDQDRGRKFQHHENTTGTYMLEIQIANINVTAVIPASILGLEDGYALADVAYGDANPSGNLAYTVVKNESGCPVVGLRAGLDCPFG